MLLSLLTLLAAPAHAEQGPYMWGVGPNLGTMIYPGEFPAYYPKVDIAEGETVAGLADNDRPEFEQVRGDLIVGARGVMYLDKMSRFGARLNMGLGEGYRALNFTAEYDFLPVDKNGLSSFVGAGAGFGNMRFEAEDVGELKLATYIFRGQAGLLYRNKTQAYEANVFVQVDLPGGSRFTSIDDVEYETGFKSYGMIGVEGTIYFGDFRPPTEGKKKKKKKGDDA